MKIHIDIESYSELDLTKVGTYNYANHISTTIDLVAYAIDHGDVRQWDCTDGSPIPADLQDALDQYHNLEWHAFNASFERQMFKYVWAIDIPVQYWHCTMVHAYMMSFTGTLGQVGKQIGLPQDKQKLSRGRQLVMKFCKPAPSSHKVDRYDRHNAPDDWAEYKLYNIQDVVAERAIDMKLLPYPVPPAERIYYQIDQEINDRGIPINRAMVDGANKILRAEKMKLKAELVEMTGLSNPTAWQQLRPWYEAKCGPVTSFDKDAVDGLITSCRPGSYMAGVLTRYRQHNRTSTAKWVAIKPAICDDNRFRGGFSFAGASRTQRWAGRVLQPHNMARGWKNADTAAEDLLTGDRDWIELGYGNVMGYLSNTIRAMIEAPEGKLLNVVDLGSIESRAGGWLSGCGAINQVFAGGRDTYRAFGSRFYGKPEADITDEERTFCKPPVLGGMYGLGGKGLVAYADSMGVVMEEDLAQRFIDVYRETYPELPVCWQWLSEACMYVTQNPDEVMEGYRVRIFRDNDYLFIQLPSGRCIAYYQPLVEWKTPPWENAKPRPTFSYMGMDQYTRIWKRIYTHGGKIFENIDQAFSRDILAVGMHRATDAGLDIVLHVHDELVAESWMDEAAREYEILVQCMTHDIDWAPGLLLAADGFTTKRYKKG